MKATAVSIHCYCCHTLKLYKSCRKDDITYKTHSATTQQNFSVTSCNEDRNKANILLVIFICDDARKHLLKEVCDVVFTAAGP